MERNTKSAAEITGRYILCLNCFKSSTLSISPSCNANSCAWPTPFHHFSHTGTAMRFQTSRYHLPAPSRLLQPLRLEPGEEPPVPDGDTAEPWSSGTWSCWMRTPLLCKVSWPSMPPHIASAGTSRVSPSALRPMAGLNNELTEITVACPVACCVFRKSRRHSFTQTVPEQQPPTRKPVNEPDSSSLRSVTREVT
eukprot:1331451-Rhodomonas_salina.2